MTVLTWNKLDQVENPPYYLTAEDQCYFSREYAAGKDYSYSTANNLIKNIKKKMSLKGTNQWQWKLAAIRQFAHELSFLLNTATADFYVAAIPCSKRRDHDEFDPRIEQVIEQMCKNCPKAQAVTPIERVVNMKPAHESGTDRPSFQQVYDSLEWVETDLGSEPQLLVLVDDVITAGKSFKVCQKIIKENAPHIEVAGVFWARTIRPDDVSLQDIQLEAPHPRD